jgi:hypothetical protein
VKSLAAALAFLALAAPAQAQTVDSIAFTDWTSFPLTPATPGTASGTLLGHPVTLSGDALNGQAGWTFPAPAFTPALAQSDEIQLFGAQPANHYTLSFGAPVTNPVLDLDSLGSTVTFPAGTQVVRVSGDPGFVVAGNQVSGSGSPDPGGTVRLVGTFSQLALTVANPSVSDGVPSQVGAPVPAATPVPTVSPTPTPTADGLPADQPPKAGVRVSAAPVSGDVTVKLPGGAEFLPLDDAASLPLGAVVDARAGALTIRTTSGSAKVAAGIFTIRQAAGRKATAALVLKTPPGQGDACAGTVHKGVVRQLAVTTTKGVVRTVAAKSAVTGRNASWTVADRCDGTLTRVRKGRVAVTARHRTKTVRAGHSLLIRARLFRARQHG